MGLLWWRERTGPTRSSRIRAFECGVRITQLSGAGKDRSADFPVEQNEILVGRDRSWADFVLPDADRLASGRHLQIRRQPDGEWEAVRLPDKYIDVDGRPISSRAKLADGSILRLGNANTGPLLRFDLLEPSREQLESVRNSISNKTTAVQQMIPPTRELVRGLRRHLALVSICLAAATAAGTYGWVRIGGDVDELARITESLKMEEARALEPPPDWRDLAETLYAAAHVVVARRDGVEWPVATAWPIAPDRMVTNAHVTEELARSDGLEIFVRNPGGLRTFEVVAMRQHPAFQDFKTFLHDHADRIGTTTPGGFRQLQLPSGYDLAILELAPGSNAGPVLQPIPPEEAGGLRVGQRIAFAGYFLRGVEGGERAHQAPVPRVHFGEISARTNFFLRIAEDDQARLIHNNIPITGGTSGGPVIDEWGRVIAIVSSGTVVSVPKSMSDPAVADRVPSAALVNFAQRADLIYQFIDNSSAFDLDAERAAYWQPEVSRFDRFGDYILDGFLADITSRDTRGFLPEREPVHMEIGRGWGVHNFTLDMEAGRGYAILAYTDGPEAVELQLDETGRARRTDRGKPARLLVTARDGGSAELRILTSGREPTSLHLFIYRTE